MVRFFGISRSVARYAERVISHESVFRQLTNIRTRIYESLAARSLLLVRDLSSGSFVKSIVDDVERAQEFALRVTLPHRVALASSSVALLIAGWINNRLLFVLIPTYIILLFITPLIATRSCVAISQDIETLEGGYTTSLSYALYSKREATMYGYVNLIADELHATESSIYRSELKLLRAIRRLSMISFLAVGFSIVSIASLMRALSLSEDIPAVQISMAIFLPLVAFEAISTWLPNLYISGKALRAKDNVDSLVTQEAQTYKGATLTNPRGILVLDGFSTSWSNRNLFSPIKVVIEPGDHCIIRGVSGAGKSTFALALCGLLPYQGSAQIDGLELSTIDNLHEAITGSLQRSHIFNTSIRENLKIARSDATDQELISLLKEMELDSISLDEVVGDFGRPLSGGEAKRLSIARALLSPAPIVVLDEPTEHLDYERAVRIEEAITRACANRTLIVITHSEWSKSARTIEIHRE